MLGDPGQLPPISGGGFFTDHEPDYLLTEIHRQARDNPIIRLALDVREGREFMRGDYGTAQVIGREDVTQELVLKADQVLVGRNQTRRRYNQRLRELKGFSAGFPQAGDKLVCLRNDPNKGLLNGSLWKVMTSSRETVKPGINLLVSPEEDDPDRGVAKIKLLEAGFRRGESRGNSVDYAQTLRRFRLRLRADRAQGAGFAVGRRRAVRRKLCLSRHAPALALYGDHTRRGNADGGAVVDFAMVGGNERCARQRCKERMSAHRPVHERTLDFALQQDYLTPAKMVRVSSLHGQR